MRDTAASAPKSELITVELNRSIKTGYSTWRIFFWKPVPSIHVKINERFCTSHRLHRRESRMHVPENVVFKFNTVQLRGNEPQSSTFLLSSAKEHFLGGRSALRAARR